jgi:hypothetical protein
MSQTDSKNDRSTRALEAENAKCRKVVIVPMTMHNFGFPAQSAQKHAQASAWTLFRGA